MVQFWNVHSKTVQKHFKLTKTLKNYPVFECSYEMHNQTTISPSKTGHNNCPVVSGFQVYGFTKVTVQHYSGDLKIRIVWISNGQKMGGWFAKGPDLE